VDLALLVAVDLALLVPVECSLSPLTISLRRGQAVSGGSGFAGRWVLHNSMEEYWKSKIPNAGDCDGGDGDGGDGDGGDGDGGDGDGDGVDGDGGDDDGGGG